jgi:hypothetical protein
VFATQIVLKQIGMGALTEADEGGLTRYLHPVGRYTFTRECGFVLI